ncbi:hypothetical protein ACQ4PT_056692 [Festuca glaucescens]
MAMEVKGGSTQAAEVSTVGAVDTKLMLAMAMGAAPMVRAVARTRGEAEVVRGMVAAEDFKQRWNNGNNPRRGGGYQNRFRANGDGVAARSTIDADLLQQTVQAVVAAVTAAQKIPESVGGTAVHNAAGADVSSTVPSQSAVMPVAAPTTIQQQLAMPNKEAMDTQVAGANGKENEGPGPLKKKKEDKTACFRCKKPGHYIDDCSTPFCDLYESIHHAASACHLFQALKPTAIIHGYANEALMFFELPCGAFKAKVENPKLAKVIVDGDAMTIPEIIEQLRRIVPYEKFNWEVFYYKDNIFRVKLPMETVHGSQEVNMVDANNGNDGNDDAHHGDGNNGGGNDMDMNPKGTDEDATSNNNEQGVSNTNNGVDGMQVQCQHIDEIQIGMMKVQLSPAGIPPSDSNLGKKDLFCMPLSHVEILSLKNKVCTDFGVDPVHSNSASGLPMVGARAVRQQDDSALMCVPAAAAASLSADSMHRWEVQRFCSMRAGTQPAADTRGHANGGAGEARSSVAGAASSNACAVPEPQKILSGCDDGPAPGKANKANHLAMMSNHGQSLMADGGLLVGSSVHVSPIANGMADASKSFINSCLDDDEYFMSGVIHLVQVL